MSPFLCIILLNTTLKYCKKQDQEKNKRNVEETTLKEEKGNNEDKCITLFRDRDKDGYSDGVRISYCGGEFPDGFTVKVKGEDDCNDLDPSLVFPEVYYKDFDKDGFTDGLTYISCGPAKGYVKEGKPGDCNDNDPEVNPLQSEICDGKDNNCDGKVDEEVSSLFYEDKDGDGFGNPRSFTQSCTIPFGFVENNLDCDDSSPYISPDENETCNRRDDNCDGSIDEGINCSAKSISVGASSSCLLASDGTLLCWGFNLLGTVGDGSENDSVLPKEITRGVQKVYVDSTVACALNSQNSLFCWGSAPWLKGSKCSSITQLENCMRTPVKIKDEVKDVAMISSKEFLSPPQMLCVVELDGKVKCKGKIKIGEFTVEFQDFSLLTDGASGISAGQNHICFLKNSNVYCWGDNSSGQLGDGTFTHVSGSPKKVEINEEGEPAVITHVCTGTKHTCAISQKGNVYCWGDNSYYQISSTLPPTLNTSTKIGNGDKLICGPYSTCILQNQKLMCRGLSVNSSFYESEKNFIRTTEILLRDGVKDASLSFFHICVIDFTGGIECRGGNFGGQLGDGERGSSETPIKIKSNVRKVKSGTYTTCAVTEDRQGICWGANISQLPKTISTQSTVDIKGEFVEEEKKELICFLKEGGELMCGGYIYPKGTLPYFTKIEDGVDQFDISTKNLCFVKQGELFCMGDNYSGQIGDGTRQDRSSPVSVLQNVIFFSVGEKNVCAVKKDRTLWCWGDNSYKQISDSTSKIFILPEMVASNITFVSVGDGTICYINGKNKMECRGKLGKAEIFGVYHVSAGRSHACAITQDNALWCWGENNFGEVGSGKRGEFVAYPTKILEGIVFVDAGKSHTCAVNSKGELMCWGLNLFGELGNLKAYSPTWRKVW